MKREETRRENDKILLEYDRLKRAGHPCPAGVLAEIYNYAKTTIYRKVAEAIRRNSQ